jgi:hypothetical protein
MSTLQLTIPTQLDDASGASKVKPREVAEWLENLPFLDLQRTAPAIHQQLRLFNRMAIAPAQRLQILDAFRTGYARLRTSTPTASQPLNFDLKTLCKKQCQDLSFGYKIAINDLLHKKLIIGQKKLLAQAIGGALDCLGHQMTYYFEAYQRTPRSLWSETVMLFRFAQEKEIDQNRGKTINNDSTSLQQIFTSTALLHLADPYQLQPKAVWKLRGYLDHHGDKALLFDSSNMEFSNTSSLIIDSSNEIKSHVLLVSISKLIKQIQNDLDLLAQPKKPVIAGFPAEFSSHEISHALKRVLATWGRLVERKSSILATMTERSNRKSERMAVHQQLELASGISSMWYALNNQRGFDPQMFDQKHGNEIDLGRAQDGNVNKPTYQYNFANCSTINRSSGGVALHVELSDGMLLHVGQVVALHRPDADTGNTTWIIAVCRWLIERRANNVDVGLQYLAREARPIAIRSRASNLSRVGVMPAFAVKQKSQNTLITPAGVCRQDALLDIYEEGVKTSVRCENLLEVCTGFERVSYQAIETS